MKNAIVLCSGGIDSVTTAYYVKKKKYRKIIILFFNYNQKSVKRERECSRKTARKVGAEFFEINLKWLGKISGSLINKPGKIKKIGRKELKDTRKESTKYYVPCRNTVFIVYALALAESMFIKEKKIYDIFLGFKNEGRESYPDTTKEFVFEMNKLGKLGNFKGKIIAPLISMDKEDIILLGKKLGVNFKNTHSCYVKNIHCGKCLACMLRKEGFYWSNEKDDAIFSP
ncbi:7-cyano-7-deazaguanine synthase [Candidatus Pacearchaeota archaeon]|nr:7-cyano-7-deazaguanine synthase [Candidatus Pacearchaeota archaeon]